MLGELWGELLGEFLAARRAEADGICVRVPLCDLCDHDSSALGWPGRVQACVIP